MNFLHLFSHLFVKFVNVKNWTYLLPFLQFWHKIYLTWIVWLKVFLSRWKSVKNLLLSVKIFLSFSGRIGDKRKCLLIEWVFTFAVAAASYQLFLRGIFTCILILVCLLNFLERFITYRTMNFDRAVFDLFNVTAKFFQDLQKSSYFAQMILLTFFKCLCYSFLKYHLGWYLFI